MKSPILLALSCALFSSSLPAVSIDDWEWPQVYKVKELEVAVYQPQIFEWDEFKKSKARMAVAIKRGDKTTFGIMEMGADTVADFEERVVHFGDRSLLQLRFPEATDKKEEESFQAAVKSVLIPTRPLSVGLDTMIANVDRTRMEAREVEVNLAPPPIFYSSRPALLVMFLGPPKFEAVTGVEKTHFAVNTNWDVLLNLADGTYYLLANDYWLKTQDLDKGPWEPVTLLPDKFYRLPEDENWKGVREKLTAPTVDKNKVPQISVTHRPAELILTQGDPMLELIPGTTIMSITNTEADLFMLKGTFYFLSAGRWFSSEKLEGPWKAATKNLPEEFAKIPSDHDRGNVLASVPGTAEAEEAVIMASIPQTATVNRAEAKLAVKYDGEPEFVDIPKTSLKFAVNTAFDVFLVNSRYYCCHQGVWFEAPTASGVWVVCTNVPDPLYSIPAEHPKNNVTYVHVYDSSPTTVTTGYTSGYNGAVVAGGLLMFGLGYWLGDNNDWDDHWNCWYRYPPHASYYAYGCGATYHPYHGGYYRSGYRAYGPYGGAGGGAAYNPWTGGYARGEYRYGPRGAAGYREAYNPWTDTYAARAGAKTPYGSWGRSAVVRDDEWARAGHRSSWRGSAGAIETSKGNAAVRVDRRFGPDGTAVKYGDDLYAGRNGNVFKRDDDGNWYNRKGGDWNEVKKPDQAPRNWDPSKRPSTQPVRQPGTRPTTRPAIPQKNSQAIQQRASQLNRTPSPTRSTVKKPTYKPKSTPSRTTQPSKQLGWDSRSRERSSYQRSRSTTSRSTRSTRSGSSRSRSAPSRSSGRSMRRR